MPAAAPIPQIAMAAPERKPVARGAVAGMLMLTALLLCGGLGALVGALTGAVGIFLTGGILVGFFAGFAAVRARFPDL